MLVPVEKMVSIKDNVNWMPGYTIEGKIGKLSRFGLDLKFLKIISTRMSTLFMIRPKDKIIHTLLI